ncbi:MAG: hypothetical protein AB7F22_32525 [Reyranella sp.]|uniref:hypothetical protein n=1 Tax=Reyranella sp. TaxID=1929291 RepID=UPI003D0C1710
MDGTIDRNDRLHQSFIAALDHLDAEQREPDRWEEECLSYALGALACGLPLVAHVEIEAFWRPAGQRSPEVVAALAGKPARFTKAMLRHGLDYVQQRYTCAPAADAGLPPALVAGQRAVQASLGR